MSASMIPEPGTEIGPCVDECEHEDCAFYREMAAITCAICGEPLGFGVMFFRDPDESFHSSCLYRRMKKERH